MDILPTAQEAEYALDRDRRDFSEKQHPDKYSRIRGFGHPSLTLGKYGQWNEMSQIL
jgi:hypothetical protein